MINKIDKQAAEVAALMKKRLGIRGQDLETSLQRAGRILPVSVEHDITYLARAAAQAKSPKLRKMIDIKRVKRAHKNSVAHLHSIDTSGRRKGAVMGILGSVVFSIFLVGALAAAVLAWRGFI